MKFLFGFFYFIIFYKKSLCIIEKNENYELLLENYNAGLFVFHDKNKELPILSAETFVNITQNYALLEISQEFYNPLEETIETEYYLPMNLGNLFYKFEVFIENKTILGQIMEKNKILDFYNEKYKIHNRNIHYSSLGLHALDFMKIYIGKLKSNQKIKIKYYLIKSPLNIAFNQVKEFIFDSFYFPKHNSTLGKMNITQKDFDFEWKINLKLNLDFPINILKCISHDNCEVSIDGNNFSFFLVNFEFQ